MQIFGPLRCRCSFNFVGPSASGLLLLGLSFLTLLSFCKPWIFFSVQSLNVTAVFRLPAHGSISPMLAQCLLSIKKRVALYAMAHNLLARRARETVMFPFYRHAYWLCQKNEMPVLATLTLLGTRQSERITSYGQSVPGECQTFCV